MKNSEQNSQFYTAIKQCIEDALRSNLDTSFSGSNLVVATRTSDKVLDNNLMITIGSILFRLVFFVSYENENTFSAIIRKELSENSNDYNQRIHEHFSEFSNLLVGDLKRRMIDYIAPLGMSTPVKLDETAILLARKGNSEREICIETLLDDEVVISIRAYLVASEDLDTHMSIPTSNEDDVMDGELELF